MNVSRDFGESQVKYSVAKNISIDCCSPKTLVRNALSLLQRL